MDLLDLCLNEGDFTAIEKLKRLRPDVMALDYARNKTELTMIIVTRVLRWCITYRYIHQPGADFFIASQPMWHFQPMYSMYNIVIYPVAREFVYKSEFILRGFLWVEFERTATGIVYRRSHAVAQATMYYEAPLPPEGCGCKSHHSVDEICGRCPLDDQDDHSYLSVRRLTRCHHLAAHDVQFIHCPMYDQVKDLNLIADRPAHKTIKYTGGFRLVNPLLLPCIAMVSLTSTFPYYKRIPSTVYQK